MKNGLRIAIGTVLSLALLLVLLLLLGPRLFANEDLQGRLQERISAALGRPVSMGTVRVRLLPQPSVRVENLVVGASPSGDQSTATVSALLLHAAWRPLLQRRLEIHRIEIDRPVIELGTEGAPSRSSSVETPQTGAVSASGSASGSVRASAGVSTDGTLPEVVDIQIDEFLVRDGIIRKLDAAGAVMFALEGWNERLTIEATREGRLHLQGTSEVASWRLALPAGNLGRGLPIHWEKSITYLASEDELAIGQSDFLLGDLPLAVTGKIRAATSADPRLDLRFSGGPASVDGILGLIPEGLMPTLEGMESSGILTVSGSVSGSTSSQEASDFELNVELEQGRVRHPAIPDPIEGLVASLRLGPDLLRVDRFSGQSGSNRIQARGVVTELQQDPQVDIALEVDLDLAWMTALRPPEPGSPTLTGRVQSEIVIRGPGNRAQDLTVLGILDLTDVSASGADLDPPLRKMSGRIEIEDQALRTDELRFLLGSSDFSVRGTIGNYLVFLPEPAAGGAPSPASLRPAEQSSVELTMFCRLLDLDAFVQDSSSHGPAEPNMSLRLLQKLRGPIRLRADTLIVRGVTTTGAAGTARLDLGRIEIDQISLGAFGGDVEIAGAINLRDAKEPVFDLKTRAASVDVARLLRESVPLGKLTGMTNVLEGTLEGTANFRGQLDPVFALQLPSLTSIGNVKIVEGRLDGHPAQMVLATFLNLPEVRSIAFADWLQPFQIRDGRLHFEGLNIQAGEYELQADGWQSMEGKLELTASVLLPRSSSEGLRQNLPADVLPILLDGTGSRVLVPVKVTGSTQSPRVDLDRERLSVQARRLAAERIAAERRALEERLQREQDELGEQIRERVRDNTDGLFERILGSPADSSARDSTTSESGVEEELKGILRGLFER